MESDFCILVIVIDILDGNVMRKELFFGWEIDIDLLRVILMFVKVLQFWKIILFMNIFKFFGIKKKEDLKE